MEKYEAHGLTREEDNILGAFGREEVETETFSIEYFAGEHLDAVKSLQRKGLIHITLARVGLTPKGVRLWHVRAREEEEGTQ